MSILELIITCEHCGHVEHLTPTSENESNRLVEKFNCPGQCSPKFYSYICISEISIQAAQELAPMAQVA